MFSLIPSKIALLLPVIPSLLSAEMAEGAKTRHCVDGRAAAVLGHASRAVIVIGARSTLETGQPDLVLWARTSNCAGSAPGTSATTIK